MRLYFETCVNIVSTFFWELTPWSMVDMYVRVRWNKLLPIYRRSASQIQSVLFSYM